MFVLLRLSYRELRSSLGRLWLPGIALVISVMSLFVFQAFEFQLEQRTKLEGRNQLGADIKIESYRKLSQPQMEEIKKVFPEKTKIIENLELNTMLQIPSKKENRFVKVIAFDSGYPLYGNYQFTPETAAFSQLDAKDRKIILPEDLASTLDLKVGDQVKVGEAFFTIHGLIKAGGEFSSGFISFAPEIWIHKNQLLDTKLLDRPGRISYEVAVQLPTATDPLQLIEPLKNAIQDPSYRISSFEEGDRGFQRIYSQVKLFAKFISLAALLLTGFAIFGAFQNYFFERRYLIAVLKTLGAKKYQMMTLLNLSTFLFALMCSTIGVVVGAICFRMLKPIVSSFLHFDFSYSLPPSIFLFAWIIGVFTPLCFGLFAILETSQYRALLLLRAAPFNFKMTKNQSVLALLLIGAIFLVVFYLLGDWKKAFYLTLSLVGILAFGALVSFGLLLGISKLHFQKMKLIFLYPLRSLLRERSLSVLGATLFFVLAMILSLVLSLESNLQKEFLIDRTVKQASLFLFDIGENEKSEVDQLVQKTANTHINWAPTIRVRWKSINGSPPVFTSSDESRFNSEFFITEQLQLSSQERLVDGKFWTKKYDSQSKALPELSLTREFARRFGIELNDVLTFELFGILFEAKVTNYRSVRWTDFQPGFRIVLQAGFLESLPLSYVGAVETSNDEDRIQIRKEMAASMPYISVVDVDRVKTDLERITKDLSITLRVILMSLLILGLIMIAIVTQEKISVRSKEFSTLRCLGARIRQLKGFLLIELALLSLIPSIVGALIGEWCSRFLLGYFFNIDPIVIWNKLFILPLFILLLVTVVVWMTSKRLGFIRQTGE